MLFSSYGFALLAAAFINFSKVAAVAPTDEYTDADPAQSGYLPNHNMDPAVVDSSQFGQLWKMPFNAQEQVRNPTLHLADGNCSGFRLDFVSVDSRMLSVLSVTD